MSKTSQALEKLTLAILDLADQQSRTATAQSDQVREQRITNLLVRSQIVKDPVEKQRLLNEAAQQMDAPRRRSPHAQL